MSILKRMLTAVFLAAYILVAAELFIRFFSPMALMPRFICATEYGVRGNVPNAHYFHSTPDYRNEFRTNSRGIRSNEEIPYEKPAGEKRVVLLGDSFAMGYDAALEEAFSSRMEATLRERGIPCKVVNLGVSGHGTAEELVTLRAEGLKYDPDLVLVAWQEVTDPDDNIRANLFRLEKGELVTANTTYLPSVKTQELLFSFAIYRWLASNSHLQVFIRDSIAESVKKGLILYRGTPKRVTAPAEEEVPLADTYPGKLSLALMEETRRESNAAGALFLVLEIPRGNQEKGYKPGLMSAPQTQEKGWMVYSPVEELNQHLDENLVWQRSSFHFTPRGNEIVGEGLARTIIELKLLD